MALLGIGLVIASTLTLLTLTEHRLRRCCSRSSPPPAPWGSPPASPPACPPPDPLLLLGLMFVGRLGPITLVSARALRERTRRYELPEERPVIG